MTALPCVGVTANDPIPRNIKASGNDRHCWKVRNKRLGSSYFVRVLTSNCSFSLFLLTSWCWLNTWRLKPWTSYYLDMPSQFCLGMSRQNRSQSRWIDNQGKLILQAMALNLEVPCSGIVCSEPGAASVQVNIIEFCSVSYYEISLKFE